MSLIFEALKKLDREKQAPERGFLVVGASGWGGGRRARALPIAAALAAAGVAGFLFAQWAQRPRVETAASATPAPAPNVGRVAPTAPPATYAAPTLSAVVREAAPPPAPSRTVAPAAPAARAEPPPPATSDPLAAGALHRSATRADAVLAPGSGSTTPLAAVLEPTTVPGA